MSKLKRILLGEEYSEEGFDEYIYELASDMEAQDFILEKMKEYADWYANKTLKLIFSHAEKFQDRHILDLNKVKNIALPEHE